MKTQVKENYNYFMDLYLVCQLFPGLRGSLNKAQQEKLFSWNSVKDLAIYMAWNEELSELMYFKQ